MEGTDGMGYLVPVGHKDKGVRLEQKVLRVPLVQGVVEWWGKTSCPNVSGTDLVYAGRAG